MDSACKHKDSCLINSLKGYLRGGVIAVGIKFILTSFRVLLKQNWRLINQFFTKDTLSLMIASILTIGLFRSTLCAVRKLTQREDLASGASGFVAGLPLAFLDSKTRLMVATYWFVRAVDILVKKAV